ncbi:MAG: hypothetical protein HFH37_13690 [Lachnospiraceae bacterium]|nr:hypothetical protein [Lachnospiraceae bacterium]
MDSALEKVGLYDFFGVFLTGILVVAIALFLELPLTLLFVNTENSIIDLILFILECYFIGVVLQEISSVIDAKFFKFQKNARSSFLNENNKIIMNKSELQSFRLFANKILGINETDHSYTTSENEYVFFYCKSFLEIEGKDGTVERINSLYGMSRSLIIAIALCLLGYLFNNGPTLSAETYPIVFALLILICLFFRRAKRFSKYRVRKILRLYLTLSEIKLEKE